MFASFKLRQVFLKILDTCEGIAHLLFFSDVFFEQKTPSKALRSVWWWGKGQSTPSLSLASGKNAEKQLACALFSLKSIENKLVTESGDVVQKSEIPLESCAVFLGDKPSRAC